MERKKRIGNERVQKILLDDDRTRFKKWIETLVNSVDSSHMIVLTNGSTRWRANFPPSRLFPYPHNHNSRTSTAFHYNTDVYTF